MNTPTCRGGKSADIQAKHSDSRLKIIWYVRGSFDTQVLFGEFLVGLFRGGR